MTIHDRDLLDQADQAITLDPAPIPSWIGVLTPAEWQIVVAAADARDELAFQKGGR